MIPGTGLGRHAGFEMDPNAPDAKPLDTGTSYVRFYKIEYFLIFNRRQEHPRRVHQIRLPREQGPHLPHELGRLVGHERPPAVSGQGPAGQVVILAGRD